MTALLILAAQSAPGADLPSYPEVVPGEKLTFPADHGAHPDYRTEWWYLTGWLETPTGPQGFQITFFRSRPRVDERNPSAFTPRQILFAHAALADPRSGKLLVGQRIARAGFGLASAAVGDTDIVLDDWTLKREADGRFAAKIESHDFGLNLHFAVTQPILPQGDAGYSQKGPLPNQASHYYSIPHLAVTGSVRRGKDTAAIRGEAWMDREWFSNLLDPRAVGWDWTGINLQDGGALMAFQLRDNAGNALWAGGSLRSASGDVVKFKPADVAFETLRRWRSPRTGTQYPIERALTLQLPTGPRRFTLTPLLDDQELDSRTSGGPIYWEGAVRVDGGRGYLELVGYGGASKPWD